MISGRYPTPLALLRRLNHLFTSVDLLYRKFDVLRCELMLSAVQPADHHLFTFDNYDRNRLFFSAMHNARLRTWERSVYRRFLPEAPAKIFVGGAGSGREMNHLLRQGHRVAGADPAAALVEHGRSYLPPANLLGFHVASYEDINRGMPAIEEDAPFDAVILGWGSISHVTQEEERRALMQKLKALCPEGPVILSWIQKKMEGNARARLRGLLKTLGLRQVQPQESFRPHMGFIYSLDAEALDSLASSAQYRVVERNDDVPYAVLR